MPIAAHDKIPAPRKGGLGGLADRAAKEKPRPKNLDEVHQAMEMLDEDSTLSNDPLSCPVTVTTKKVDLSQYLSSDSSEEEKPKKPSVGSKKPLDAAKTYLADRTAPKSSATQRRLDTTSARGDSYGTKAPTSSARERASTTGRTSKSNNGFTSADVDSVDELSGEAFKWDQVKPRTFRKYGASRTVAGVVKSSYSRTNSSSSVPFSQAALSGPNEESDTPKSSGKPKEDGGFKMSPAISHDLENLKILSQESKTSEKASKNSGFKMPPKIDPSMLPADEKEEISEKPKRVGGFKVPDSVANDLEKISAFEERTGIKKSKDSESGKTSKERKTVRDLKKDRLEKTDKPVRIEDPVKSKKSASSKPVFKMPSTMDSLLKDKEIATVLSSEKRKFESEEIDELIAFTRTSSCGRLSDSDDSTHVKKKQKSPKKRKPTTSNCPVCSTSLSEDAKKLLASFGSTLDTRQRIDFCKGHKKLDAIKAAANSKYPAADINWQNIRDRASAYMAALEAIVKGERQTRFRGSASDDAKKTKGNVKAVFQSNFQGYTPGYYGPKGAFIFGEMILSKLGGVLSQYGSRDELIAKSGAAAFTQTVLVPELAVRLIMEDMNVDEDEAAGIMLETVGIGELLNDDQGGDSDDEFEGSGWVSV